MSDKPQACTTGDVPCCSKKSDQPDKESIFKEAVASAKLWEARYNAVDQSRLQYRSQSLRLAGENEALQSAISKTEKDTIEVSNAFIRNDTPLNILRR